VRKENSLSRPKGEKSGNDLPKDMHGARSRNVQDEEAGERGKKERDVKGGR